MTITNTPAKAMTRPFERSSGLLKNFENEKKTPASAGSSPRLAASRSSTSCFTYRTRASFRLRSGTLNLTRPSVSKSKFSTAFSSTSNSAILSTCRGPIFAFILPPSPFSKKAPPSRSGIFPFRFCWRSKREGLPCRPRNFFSLYLASCRKYSVREIFFLSPLRFRSVLIYFPQIFYSVSSVSASQNM